MNDGGLGVLGDIPEPNMTSEVKEQPLVNDGFKSIAINIKELEEAVEYIKDIATKKVIHLHGRCVDTSPPTNKAEREYEPDGWVQITLHNLNDIRSDVNVLMDIIEKL